MVHNKRRISVLTATYNSYPSIKDLAMSIRIQKDELFEWIIVDGGSNDGTVEFLQSFSDEYLGKVQYISEPDFGVYDALNKAIGLAEGEYYIVIGADDIFEKKGIKSFHSAIEAKPNHDVYLSYVLKDGIRKGGFHKENSWLGHQHVFLGSHSVGMLIKKQLHEDFGLYSNRFPLLADGYFLKKLLKSKNVSFVQLDFTSGSFSTEGISNQGKIQSLAETWQIQLLTEKNILLQTVLFLMKLLLRYAYVKDELK